MAEGRKGHGEGKALPVGEILSGFREPQSLCKSQAKKRARELGIGFEMTPLGLPTAVT